MITSLFAHFVKKKKYRTKKILTKNVTKKVKVTLKSKNTIMEYLICLWRIFFDSHNNESTSDFISLKSLLILTPCFYFVICRSEMASDFKTKIFLVLCTIENKRYKKQ